LKRGLKTRALQNSPHDLTTQNPFRAQHHGKEN
jgi:hypothetical protein